MPRALTTTAASLLILSCLATAVRAQEARHRAGIEGREAPSWTVDSWHGLAEGTSSIDVSDYRGKVVYLYFFQSWCPGCHRHGFPTLKAVHDELSDASDVEFVTIQTVFEGFGENTADRLRRTQARYGLQLPFGHDVQPDGAGLSSFMQDYQTGGTPWFTVIYPDGRVIYADFHLDPARFLAALGHWGGLLQGCFRRFYRGWPGFVEASCRGSGRPILAARMSRDPRGRAPPETEVLCVG